MSDKKKPDLTPVEDKPNDENPTTEEPVSPRRAVVKLNRAHRAEVRLAYMTITEAETRFRSAQDAMRTAQTNVMSARDDSVKVQQQILRELNLSPDNQVDVERLVVVPPQGESYVKENG